MVIGINRSQKTLSYTGPGCQAQAMTNSFLTKPAAAAGALRASPHARVGVVTFVTFRAEI